jgi:ribosomal protein S18 acetylase RimI-like enzyme
MKIEELTDFSTTNLDAINGLLPQLSPSVVALEEGDLRNIVDSESTKLFLAIDEDGVFGMLSLVLFRIPTGRKAWVEDVVVDEKARGRGVGKLLTEHAIQVAREHGAHSVDLTSRPSREAANALYQRVGFPEPLHFPFVIAKRDKVLKLQSSGSDRQPSHRPGIPHNALDWIATHLTDSQ